MSDAAKTYRFGDPYTPSSQPTSTDGTTRLSKGGRFEELMSLLGLYPGEFDAVEFHRFDASPRRWLEEKLAKQGYVKHVPLSDCERSCCKERK